jgi:hypothetical protein
MKSQTTGRCHPLHKHGYEQLEVMDIDFSRRILRPTKELVTNWVATRFRLALPAKRLKQPIDDQNLSLKPLG